MRRKKPFVFLAMVFVFSYAVVFSKAEQEKVKTSAESTHRNNYLEKRKSSGHVKYNQGSFSEVLFRTRYSFPVRDNFLHLVPTNVIVEFKVPVSGFEAAYLFDHYRLKKSIGEDVTDIPIRTVFPEPPPEVHKTIFDEQFLYRKQTEALEAVMQQEEPIGEANQDFIASRSIRKEVKADKRIQCCPEGDRKTRKIRSPDPKRNHRSKSEIYTYKNKKGRIVFTNYGRKQRTLP